MLLDVFSSKLRFGNLGAILLPGMYWSVGIFLCFGKSLSNTPIVIIVPLLIVLAYFVGRCNHLITEQLFLNNFRWKKFELNLFSRTLQKYKEESCVPEQKYLWVKWHDWCEKYGDKSATEQLNGYNQVYRQVRSKTYCQDIPIMEIQFVFARNLFLPILFTGILCPLVWIDMEVFMAVICLLCCICIGYGEEAVGVPCALCCIFLLCGVVVMDMCCTVSYIGMIINLILLIGLVWFIRERQRKIFRLVIENYEYLDFEPEKEVTLEG